MGDLIELNDKTLIDLLLEEQRNLDTPVGRFAETVEAAPRNAGSYQGLLPLTAPGAGEQYAFEVNLDKCSGCKGCVTACHSMNGLDEGETWRDVGLLVGGDDRNAFQQTVTSACHHCVDPACLNGCPVNAYEKDPLTGIVFHLDDQCIGCQYCVLKCPYDAPKYSKKRGIVRKCDMCHSRLSDGEAPACVQACPHEAIKIVTVEQAVVVKSTRESAGFLADAPAADYTIPTTRFVSAKGLPRSVKAADANALRPQDAHWPLVAMLTLSQIGIGGFVICSLLIGALSQVQQIVLLSMSWLFLQVGIASSVLHLGKPLKAWRVFLGLRTSWLSREAVVFGGVSALANVAVALFVFENWVESGIVGNWLPESSKVSAAVAMLGLGGVFSSAYIYIDTRRTFWRPLFSFAKFFGTAALGALAIGALAQSWQGDPRVWANGLAVVGLAKLVVEYISFRENRASLRLVLGPLDRAWRVRLLLGILAYCVAPAVCIFVSASWGAIAAILLLTASELTERSLYFRAVNAPKMPGGVAT